jgi:hypothetical protein
MAIAAAKLRPNRAAKLHRRRKNRFLKNLGYMEVQSMPTFEGVSDELRASVAKMPEAEYVLDLIESLSALVYQVSRSRNVADVVAAMLVFIKSRTKKSLVMAAMKHAKKLINDIFREDEVQSVDDKIAQLRLLVDNYGAVCDSVFAKKVYRLLMYGVSLSLFDSIGLSMESMGYNKMEQVLLKKKYHVGHDLFRCLLETTVFILERGRQCYITGSYEPLLHSGGAYVEWLTEAQRIKSLSACTTNLEPHGTTLFQFLADLDSALEKGASIERHSYKTLGKKDDQCELRMVQRLMADLRVIRDNELTKKAARQTREAPFAILIAGKSSVGKSAFSHLLFQHFAKLRNLPSADEHRYQRNFSEEYWSGFATSQWCVHLDDVAYRRASHPQGDSSLDEIIQIVNNIPYVPNQADLCDKGKTPLRAKLVTATTNADHLNAHAYFHCELAVRRRFPFVVEIAPKEQYAKEGSMLDGSRVPPLEDGTYPDLWNIVVKKVVPTNFDRMNQGARLEVVREFGDIYDFIAYFSELADLHDEQQAKALAGENVVTGIQLCGACRLPEKACRCVQEVPGEMEVQSIEVVVCAATNCVTASANWLGGMCMSCILFSAWVTAIFAQRGPDMVESTYVYVMRTRLFRWIIIWGLRQTTGRLVPSWAHHLMGTISHVRVRHTAKWAAMFAVLLVIVQGATSFYVTRKTTEVVGTKIKKVVVNKCRKILLNRACDELMSGTPTFVNIPYSCAECDRESSGYFSAALGKHFCAFHFLDVEGEWDMIKEKVGPEKAGEIFDQWQAMWSEENTQKAVVDEDLDEDEPLAYDAPVGHVQGNEVRISERIGGRIETDTEQREQVWYKNDYQTTTFDVNPLTTSWKDDYQRARRQVLFNTAHVFARRRCGSGYLKREGRLLCVSSHVWMTNNHVLPSEGDFELVFTRSASKDGVTQNKTMLIRQSQVKRFPEHEVAFIELRDIPPKQRIVDLFPNATLQGKFRGEIVGIDEGGANHMQSVSVTSKDVRFVPRFEREFEIWSGYVKEPTRVGQCGSPWLVNSPRGPIILGIHFLGLDLTAGCKSVSKDIVERGIQQCTEFEIQSSEPVLSAPSAKLDIVPLHNKSPIRFIQNGTANVYGSLTGSRSSSKSHVTRTVICEAMEKRGYQVKFGAPVMRGWMPWRKNLIEMVQTESLADDQLIRDCATHFARDILKGVTKKELSELMVLDNMSAVNGLPGVTYVDKINRSTSMGNPWKKSKKHFLHSISADETWQEPVAFSDEVMDRVDDIIERYQKGVRWYPNFCAHLKDEATSFKKIEAQKTRVFTGAPADWSLVVRKYLLSFVRLMQNNRFVFEAGPGTVCQSLEWQEIREYLVQFGEDRIVAGDYGKFDKRMSASFVLAAFDVIIAVHRTAGWSEEDLRILKCIAEDTAFPLVDFNGDLIEFYGTNPSGHPLTVIVNSLVNSLYMRYVFAKLSEEREDVTVADFQKYVKLMTYGDDNVMGVSVEADWFNHTAIQNNLAAIGVEYTMADKESESVPFVHINDVSFLKRTWVFDPLMKCYLAPLDHDSIEKMLTIGVASNTICAEAQAVAVIEAALNEYFYYGKLVFEEKRKMLMEVVNETDIDHFVTKSTFPTWEALEQRFWNSSKHVKLGKFTP